jgi:hypothetical protein
VADVDARLARPSCSAWAARQTTGLANSIATEQLASWCLSPWKAPTGWPNWVRTLAYSTAWVSIASASPTSCAALISAPRSLRRRSSASVGWPSGQIAQGSTLVQGRAFAVGHPRIDRVRHRDPLCACPRRPHPARRSALRRATARRRRAVSTSGSARQSPAAFGGDQGGFDQPHAQPAVRLGHEQAGQAHVDQSLPDRRIAVALRIEAAQHFGAVGSGQVIAYALGQGQLVIGKAEVHQPAPTRGRPSSRSAVMLRCTSFDPA